MARRPDELDRIDIDLNLIGEGAAGAIDRLAAQLQRTEQLLTNMGSQTAEQRVQTANRLATTNPHPQTGFNTGLSQSASQPANAPGIIDGDGVSASHAARLEQEENQSMFTRGWRAMRRGVAYDDETRRGLGAFLDREIELYARRENQQIAERGGRGYREPRNRSIHSANDYDLDMSMTPQAGSADGVASPGASIPVNMSRRDTRQVLSALRSNPGRYARGEESFEIPQYGEFTIQDKLNMASNFFQQRTARAYGRARDERRNEIVGNVQSTFGFSDEDLQREDVQQVIENRLRQSLDSDQITAGLGSGRTAMALRLAADNSAQAYALASQARRAYNWGSGISQAGVQAGFDRGGTIGIGPFGVQNPFGSAFWHGVGQRASAFGLSLRGGINREQANSIFGGLIGAGWGGNNGELNRLAFDTVAPLVQQGQNPEIVTGLLDRAIRQGNTSLDDFRKTMDKLGPAARIARMSLDEYQQALGDFAEQAQGQGATFGRGLQLGRNLSSATGLAPQVAGNLLFQSPLVQGAAMAQTGLLPGQLGLLNSSSSVSAIYSALDMAEQATGVFGQQTTRLANGQVISGRDAQDAAMAQILGGNFTPDVIKRLRRERGAVESGSATLDRLQTYTSHAEALQRATQNTVHTKNQYLAARTGNRAMPVVQTSLQRRHQAMGNRTLNQEWQNLRGSLLGLAPEQGTADRTEFDKRIRELDAMDPAKRGQEAQKYVQEQLRKATDPINNEPSVRVKFTGMAAKFFEQDNSGSTSRRRTAQSGGPPLNNNATGPSPVTQNEVDALLRAGTSVGGG